MGLLTPAEVAYIGTLPRDEQGLLLPSTVVEFAASEDSPLHKHFDWDDASAASKHRIHQARVLINGWRITVEHEERTITVPMFVESPDKPKGAQGYMQFSQLQQEPETAQRVLTQEIDRAMGHLHRAMRMASALGLDEELAAPVETLTTFRERVEQMTLAQPAA